MMSDIKMSDSFALPLKKSMMGICDEARKIHDGFRTTNQDKFAIVAINNHDTLTNQVAQLRALLSETKGIIESSSAVTDTVWYNDHTTMCDKIQLTLEGVDDE